MASPPIPPKPSKPPDAIYVNTVVEKCPDSPPRERRERQKLPPPPAPSAKSPPSPSHSARSPPSPSPSTKNQECTERDYDFVVPPSPDFFCPVSMELLLEPQLTSCCGHHLSLETCTRLQKEGKACPLCKESTWTTVLDKFHSRRVRELRVRCPHKSNGCGWVGEVNDLERHTESCPLKLVPCDMKEFGCSAVVLRKDLATHMRESGIQHLTSMAVLNLQLTRQLQQDLAKKDKKISQLQQEMTEGMTKLEDHVKTKVYKLPVHTSERQNQWTRQKIIVFDQYSKLRGFKKVNISDPFYSHEHGYKFILKINYLEDTTVITFFLLSGDHDDQLPWPVEAEIQVELLNQAGDHHHVTRARNFEWYKEDRGKVKVIDSPFMTYEELEKEEDGIQYVMNDFLRFRLVLSAWPA